MQEVVTLRDLRLPEFDKERCISQQRALVFDNDKVKYDMILAAMYTDQPMVLITLRSDHDVVLHRQCDAWNAWTFADFSIYGATVFINGAYKLRALAQIPISTEVLENLSKVHVEVVNPAVCGKHR